MEWFGFALVALFPVVWVNFNMVGNGFERWVAVGGCPFMCVCVCQKRVITKGRRRRINECC